MNPASTRPAVAPSLVVVAVLLAAGPAAGQDRLEGTVLRIDGQEVLVDIGARDGVSAGDEVVIYRRIRVQHPVTGRNLEDRFPIGEVALTQVADRLSIVVLARPLAHPPSPGDVVVRRLPEPPAPTAAVPAGGGVAADDPASCPACEPADCPAPDPAPCPSLEEPQRRVLLALDRTLGRPVDLRIAVWEGFLASNPDSPYRAAVVSEVENLRNLLRASRTAEDVARAEASRVGHAPPEQGFVGEPLDVVLALPRDDGFALLQIHLRRIGESAYRSFDLAREGDMYARIRIPEEYVAEDGFEYHLTGVTTGGVERSLGGRGDRPLRVEVAPRTETPPPVAGRSSLHTSTEYVDFYVTDAGRDWYVRFEADFRYRIGTWFEALRIGFGVFEGNSGPVSRIDLAADDPHYLAPQPISYRYGLVETEFRIHELFYVLAQISFGSARPYVLADGRSEAPEALIGGQAKVRIGRPQGTHLILGGGYIEDLGYEVLATVNISVLDDVPLRGHVIVTDMPVQEDLGVRLVAEAGWRPLPWFEFTGLIGYGIRTIRHAGLSAGLALSFLW
jgi:hypothetical protein